MNDENLNKSESTSKMSDVEKVLTNMEWLATMNGYTLTKHAPAIAKAKCRFFGVDNWDKCPCDPDSDRACISAHCHQDIKADGHCHCNAYEPMKGVDDADS